MVKISIFWIILLSTNTLLAQNYKNTFPHFSWEKKLLAQINNKVLQSLIGKANSYDGKDIVGRGDQFTVDNPDRNEHLAWGGFYSFTLIVHSENANSTACSDTIDPDRPKIQVLTTKLMGMIKKNQCVSVTGAYDNSGNFIARKIINLETNHIAAEW